MVLAGVSAVLLATIAWMLRSPATTESRDAKAPNSVSKSSASSLDLTDASARRERRAQSAAPRHDAGFTRHDAGKLVNFILPNVEGKDVAIQQALAILKEAYQDACFRSREKALDLKFTVKDDPGGTIWFSLKGKSFVASLNYIAALAGLEAKRNATDIELFRSESADQPAEFSFNSLSTNLAHYSLDLTTARSMPLPAGCGLPDYLRSSGLVLDQGTVITTNTDGTLHIAGSTVEINRVRAALEIAKSDHQIKVSNRLISTDQPINVSSPNLTADENSALMRELAQRAGTQLTTEPSITARDSQSATIEIIREKIVGNQTDWTGIRHEISAGFTGLKLVGSDKSENRPENADGSGWLSENEFALYPGDTHVQLVSSGNGKYQYRLLTVTPIDATGRPLINGQTPAEDTTDTDPDSQENTIPIRSEVKVVNDVPTASRVPGKTNFVFSPYNNRVVDVEGMPSGTLVCDPTYPSEEKKLFRVP